MPRIFITDVKYRMAVPAIRAFGKAGFHITALEYDDTPPAACLGFFSRYTAATLRLPRDEGAFCAGLLAAAASQPEKPVLMVFGRHTLGVLSRHPELTDFLHTLTPSPEALETADNKHAVLALGHQYGIPIPFTATAALFEDLNLMAGAMPMPSVIKYQNGEALGLHAAQRYRIVKTHAEFRRTYEEMAQRQANPLAQEYISGDGLGVSLVLDRRSRLVDFLCHRRIREYPVSGGPSCCCESIFSRPMLLMALELLQGMAFTGVAMVEFKGTPEKPVLMEVNPRFWGSSPLIYAADATFYASVAAAAMDQAVPLNPETCEPTYRVGRKMRFFPQDMLAFAAYCKAKDRRALGCLKDVFNPRIKDGLFSLTDPVPFFRYLLRARS